MRKSVTIGEFIEECYAYPYSKEYFELCQECAKSEIRALARECMEFPESVEFIGTDFFESGPVSEPDYFLPYNESVFMEKKNTGFKTTKDKELEGIGIFTRALRFIKNIAKKFCGAAKKFLFGAEKNAKKVTLDGMKAFFSNKDHEFNSGMIRDMLSRASGMSEADAVDFFAGKPFGTAMIPRIYFDTECTKVEIDAFKNYVGFIFAVAKKDHIRVMTKGAAWNRYQKKHYKGGKNKQGNRNQIGNIIDDSKNIIMSIPDLASWLEKFNKADVNSKGFLNFGKSMKVEATRTYDHGIEVGLGEHDIDAAIARLNALEQGLDEIGKRQSEKVTDKYRDPGYADLSAPENMTDASRHVAEVTKTLSTLIANTLSFYAYFEKFFKHAVKAVTDMKDYKPDGDKDGDK